MLDRTHRRGLFQSLSARRAWIEIVLIIDEAGMVWVALRKESVDRNDPVSVHQIQRVTTSLSARRAWIEMSPSM